MKEKLSRDYGDGSVYQLPSGKWQAAASLGMDAQGKRIRPRGTGATKEEAKAKLKEKLIAMGAYDPTQEYEPEDEEVYAPDITVAEFAEDYFRKVFNRNEQTRTLRDYLYSMRLFTEKYGDWPVKNISSKQLRLYYEWMVGIKDNNGEYLYGQTTVNKVKRITRLLFRRAVEKGIIERSPYDNTDLRIPKSKKLSNPVKAYTEDEMFQIMEVSKKDIQLHTMIMLSVYTGMRAEEVLALRWGCIDIKRSMILVREAQTMFYKIEEDFTVSESKAIESKTKTTQSTRALPIGAEVLELLADWKEQAASVSNTKFGAQDFVFGSKKANKITYSGYRQRAVKFFEKEMPELGNFKLHRLRHMAATLAAIQNIPTINIQHMLGHTRLETTQRYIASNQRMIEQATNGVAAALKEMREKQKGQKIGERGTV